MIGTDVRTKNGLHAAAAKLNPLISTRLDFLIPLTAVGAGALSLILLAERGEFSHPFLILLGMTAMLALTAIALGRFPIPDAPAGPVVSRSTLLWFTLAAAAIFSLSASRDLEFFPAALDGESANAAHQAEAAIRSWEQGKSGDWIPLLGLKYKSGLTPFLIPAIWWFGSSSLTVKWTYIVVWAVVLACCLTILVREIQPRVRLIVLPWCLLALLPAGAFLASLRRYKWHGMSLVAALGICLVATSFGGRSRSRLVLGLALTALAVLLYHGNIIFLPGLALLAIIQMRGADVSRKKRANGIAVLLFCALVLLVYVLTAGQDPKGLQQRIAIEGAFLPGLRDDLMRHQLGNSLLALAPEFLSAPLLLLVFLGMGAALARMRRSALAQANLILFVTGFGLCAILRGVGNADWNCWFVVPVLFFAVLGVMEFSERLASAIPSPVVAATLIGAGAIYLGQTEWHAYEAHRLYRYLDSSPIASNGEQLAFVQRSIRDLPPEISRRTLHLIPALGSARQRGGFDREWPMDNEVGSSRAAGVRLFHNDNELRQIIADFSGGSGAASHLVVWLSDSPDKSPPDEDWRRAVFGVGNVHCKLVTLVESPYPEPIRVWRMDMMR